MMILIYGTYQKISNKIISFETKEILVQKYNIYLNFSLSNIDTVNFYYLGHWFPTDGSCNQEYIKLSLKQVPILSLLDHGFLHIRGDVILWMHGFSVSIKK